MTSIKTLTKQEYEKNTKSPSEFIFYKTESELPKIIGLYLAKNLKENLEITKKFLSLEREVEVYETEKDGKVLYIVKYSE